VIATAAPPATAPATSTANASGSGYDKSGAQNANDNRHIKVLSAKLHAIHVGLTDPLEFGLVFRGLNLLHFLHLGCNGMDRL
jgi:hypothetical protein